ncbi:hypothetical protein TIFTF001_017388 [Ficus carica]|uniref:Uncharacterized protein n=1 Tax=Ficus carica TaxID=3494 RepID=A0AA88AL32_FICCA|nr:hypothetical protein TIFTF001_017388 [Ficus carica]
MARSVKGNGFPSPSGGVTCRLGSLTWKRGAWRRLTFSEKKRTPSGTSIGFSLPTAQPGEVTVASRMPYLIVHYRARTVVTAEVATTSDGSEVPRGVSVAPSHGQWFDSSSLGTWGPRVADKDMDLNPRWLSGNSEGVNALMTRTGWPGFRRSPKLVMVARAERGLRSQSRVTGPLPQAAGPLYQVAGPLPTLLRPWQAAQEKTPDLVIRLSQPPGSSRSGGSRQLRSTDLVDKLVETICLAFSGNVAMRDLFNHMEEKVTSLDSEAKSAKSAEEKAKAAEEKVKDAEKRASQVEDDLAAARSEHSRYL